MSLKENLLDVINATTKLLKSAPQTIEVRSALKWNHQVHGAVSQMSDDVESMEEVRGAVSEALEPTTPLPQDEADALYEGNDGEEATDELGEGEEE